MLEFMEKKSALSKVIAANLRFFMERPGCEYRNANALGIAAKVAPNTVRNLLMPTRRTVTLSKPEGYPTLDKLERIAEKLECEVWELLHPDVKRSLREREMYKNIEHDYIERIKESREELTTHFIDRKRELERRDQ